MDSKTITVFDWSDIQTEICEEMGMDESYFREYQEIVGGERKDLWHIWLEYFDTVINDTIRGNDLGESMESKIEWLCRDGNEWVIPFVEVVYKVWDRNNIEYVCYSW